MAKTSSSSPQRSGETPARSIFDAAFNTPLVELRSLFADVEARVFLKLETLGPSGSIKDRAVVAMYESARELGLITPSTKVVEATRGAEAFALACLAASRQFPLTIVAPEDFNGSKVKRLEELGARVELTPTRGGMNAAIARAKELEKIGGDSSSYWRPNLFDNPAAVAVHEMTTGPEIWRALDGDVDAFVAGVGSGSSFTGVARYLKRMNPNADFIAVEPSESPTLTKGASGLHGIVGLGAGFVPKFFDRNLPTRIACVSTNEAKEWRRLLMKTEGIVASVSTGANLAAVAQYVGLRENRNKTVVTLAFERGAR